MTPQCDTKAQRDVERLSVDQGPDGQRLSAYQIKCINVHRRGVETFGQIPRQKECGGRAAEDSGTRTLAGGQPAEDPGLCTVDTGGGCFGSRS